MSNPCRGIMRMRKGAHGDEDSPEGCHAGCLPARAPPRVYPRGDLGWDRYWSPGGRTRQPSQTTTLSSERSLPIRVGDPEAHQPRLPAAGLPGLELVDKDGRRLGDAGGGGRGEGGGVGGSTSLRTIG